MQKGLVGPDRASMHLSDQLFAVELVVKGAAASGAFGAIHLKLHLHHLAVSAGAVF